MDNLKRFTTAAPIHSRSIEIKSYPVDEDSIVVEGWLRDERFQRVYDVTGEVHDPGPIHDMAIRIKVGGSPMAIHDAEAEMDHVPLAFCHTTRDIIKQIVGLEIKAGFAKRVKALMGGEKGCSHLTHLLTVMSQAAFQGYLNYKRLKQEPIPHSLSDVEGVDNLVGSCRAWSADGPKMEKLLAVFAGRDHEK